MTNRKTLPILLYRNLTHCLLSLKVAWNNSYVAQLRAVAVLFKVICNPPSGNWASFLQRINVKNLNSLTLERLNGSFLTHSELQLHATQHPVTVEGKHFMTLIAFWGQMHSKSSMIISNTLAKLQQEIPRKPEWVIFDPCRTITRNKCKHDFYSRFCKLFYVTTPVLE